MKKMTCEALFWNKSDCCGCELCSQVCPKNIISMSRDEEGFLYPEIKDNTECVGCGKCQKVCPVKHVTDIRSAFSEAYAGWANDSKEIISSSSGGAASVIARAFIRTGGVVYGVAYTNQCKDIEYIRAADIDSVERFKTSKYAQASKPEVYRNIQSDLLRGNKVLFVGVPCDCAAVRNIFGKNELLYIISLICHGPTSPLVHKQFCSSLEKKSGAAVASFSLRHKKDDQWKPYYIKADFDNGTSHTELFGVSDYNKAFLFFKRPSCNSCQFKNDKFAADLLLGDYHAAKAGAADYNSHGVSSILVLTDKGKDMLNMISGSFSMTKVNKKTALHQQAIHHPVKARANRKAFSKALVKDGLHKAANMPSTVLLQKKDSVVHSMKVSAAKLKKRLKP